MGKHHEKLFFLLPSLAGGGAQRVAVMLLPMLSQHFDLTLILLENQRAYKVPKNIDPVCFSEPLGGAVSHLMRIPYHVFKLVRMIHKSGARIVLSFMEEANFLNIISSFFTGHRAIVSQRIVSIKQHKNKGILGEIILVGSKILYPRAAHVLSVSEQIRSNLKKDFGLPSNRVTFIPNPIDLQAMLKTTSLGAPQEVSQPYILHVGRLTLSQKGQDILLRAFAQIRDRWPSHTLVLVGEGPDRETIRRLARSLGLDRRLVLTGWQNNVAALMKGAELLVFPSRYEGWPNVLLEAMACGCPVIATDCQSGPREIIGDNEYGRLVPVNNPDALAKSMEELMEAKELAEELGQQGRQRVEEFSIEAIGRKYLEILTKQMCGD